MTSDDLRPSLFESGALERRFIVLLILSCGANNRAFWLQDS